MSEMDMAYALKSRELAIEVRDRTIDELRSQNAALREWQSGARENASDLAAKLGVDPENMDDVEIWHASVKPDPPTDGVDPANSAVTSDNTQPEAKS